MSNRVFAPSVPDSPAPFVPMNPWGRAMPKVTPPGGARAAMQEQLYQCFVTEKRNGGRRVLIAVGPRICEDLCRNLCQSLGEKIARGEIRDWSEPHVMKVPKKLGSSNPLDDIKPHSGMTAADFFRLQAMS